jgi:phosphodiesterase/alkaline phosphatase D-like protein
VKVRIDDLAPGTTYYYRATNAAGESETGQFETASPTGTQAGLHFGVSGD